MRRTDRLWVGCTAVVALLMALTGYFLLIAPQRAHTASVRADVSAAAFQETTLQSRIASLRAQNERITAYRAELNRARRALPASDDLTATPQLLRSLATAATTTSTTITDLTVGDPVPMTATPAPSSATPPTSTTAASGAPAQGGAPSLSSIAIGLTVTGSSPGLTRFLTDLQSSQSRALFVSAVSLADATGTDAGVTTRSLKLTMTAFVRPAGG